MKHTLLEHRDVLMSAGITLLASVMMATGVAAQDPGVPAAGEPSVLPPPPSSSAAEPAEPEENANPVAAPEPAENTNPAGNTNPVAALEPAAEPEADEEPRQDALPLADVDATDENDADELTDAHRPNIRVAVAEGEPMTGDLIEVTLIVDAVGTDDISIPADQSFAPFEVLNKDVRVTPRESRAEHRFTLGLLALEPGEHEVGPVRVRVLTDEGVIGEVETETLRLRVGSLLGNEPSAEPQPPTEPVELLEEDPTLYWLGGGLLVVLLTALLTWLLSRWWRRRVVAAAPPPPPRPAHEIAIEKLNALRNRRDRMLEEGEGEAFVDGVSDAVREYLGHRYGFEGLESTTDEVIQRLDRLGPNVSPRNEISALLKDCDLVKFARAGFTGEQSDLLLRGSFHIVQTTMHGMDSVSNASPESAGTADSLDASPSPATKGESRWGPPAPQVSSSVDFRGEADVAHPDPRSSGFTSIPLDSASDTEPDAAAIPTTNPPPAFASIPDPDPAPRPIPDTLPPPAPGNSSVLVDTAEGDAFGQEARDAITMTESYDVLESDAEADSGGVPLYDSSGGALGSSGGAPKVDVLTPEVTPKGEDETQ